MASETDSGISEVQSSQQTEQQPQVKDEYSIKCPEYVSAEEVNAHTQAFKEAGVDAQTAQKVVDKLISSGEILEKQRAETLNKSLEADKDSLIKELGAEYGTRESAISRYFNQENIPDDDVKALISTWGFKKTFKFFDRYAQLNKESSAGDTFNKTETAGSSQDFSKKMEGFEFYKNLKSGDPKASELIKQWALEQAQSDQ
ncbi:hypothetical protein [Candidatus Liberibacter americanus]|uniref:hypothetical protein n=1 Tax=Candidatus Liberibacter americanus TaxID=309868 RepID=UPI00118262A0|nr:hypothetical protein [Candidatus Liberibacter americanus]